MGNGRIWLKGLLAATIGGGANAVSAVWVDPAHFNMSPDGLVAIIKMFGAGALVGAFLYLKQAPMPNGPR